MALSRLLNMRTKTISGKLGRQSARTLLLEIDGAKRCDVGLAQAELLEPGEDGRDAASGLHRSGSYYALFNVTLKLAAGLAGSKG